MTNLYRETRDLDEVLADQAIAERDARLAQAEKLLCEVSACFTRDDELPDGLQGRIDAFLRPSAQAQEAELQSWVNA